MPRGTPTKLLSVRIPPDLIERLHALAAAERRTIGAQLEVILEKALAAEPGP